MKITKRQLNKIIMEELTSILNLQEKDGDPPAVGDGDDDTVDEDLKNPKLKGGTVADVKVGLGKKDQRRLDHDDLGDADADLPEGLQEAVPAAEDNKKLRQSVKDKTIAGQLDGEEDPDFPGKSDSSKAFDKALQTSLGQMPVKESVLTKEQFARAKATIKEALKSVIQPPAPEANARGAGVRDVRGGIRAASHEDFVKLLDQLRREGIFEASKRLSRA